MCQFSVISGDDNQKKKKMGIFGTEVYVKHMEDLCTTNDEIKRQATKGGCGIVS